ncbi:MAG TPA: hypothetical protein VFM45_03760, partial [Anaeromyxobacteraceae bacterium]|nr:hypothetical protein [Anaeromyxobacteraceae bacterium]
VEARTAEGWTAAARTAVAETAVAETIVEGTAAAETDREADGRATVLAALRLQLSPGDDELLEWRGIRGIPWRTIAAFRAWKGDRSREAALRKRFQRIKARLAREARGEARRGGRRGGGTRDEPEEP